MTLEDLKEEICEKFNIEDWRKLAEYCKGLVNTWEETQSVSKRSERD